MPSLRWAILGDICKMNGLFIFYCFQPLNVLLCIGIQSVNNVVVSGEQGRGLFTSPHPPSLIYKRNWHPDPMRWLFWDISLPFSWSVGFANKVIFHASTPQFPFIGLVGSKQSELEFGNSQSVSQFSRSVMSDSLWPHGLQHARPTCPSRTPGVYSNSCPSSQWGHPTSSSSVVPFSSTFNLSQHQGLFQWVTSSHQVAKVLEFQLQLQFFQWIFRTDFL